MSIKEYGGRWRSDLSKEELLKLLSGEMSHLDAAELQLLSVMLDEASRGESELVESAVDVEYDRPLVDIRTYLEDPYYMGKVGGSMWPKLKEDMIELFEGGYNEAILTGSIGWGKDFFATTALTYVIYQASCLRNPQAAYGLAPGSPIHFIPISVKVDLARRVVFEGVAQKVAQSPYFCNEFAYAEGKSEIRFPKDIIIVGGASTNTSALGLNCFGAIIDECVIGSTLISTPTGSQRADSLCDGGVNSINILALNHDTGEIVSSDGFIKPASVTDVFEVTLDNGQSLTATREHPFLVRSGGSLAYVKLSELQVGDEVVLSGQQGNTESYQESSRREKEGSPEGSTQKRGLLFQGGGEDEEGWYVRLPVVIREEGHASARQQHQGSDLRIRGHRHPIHLQSHDSPNDPRLSTGDVGWGRQDSRGEGQAVHELQERAGEASCLPRVLPEARVDLRSVDGGRDLARIDRISSAGRHQTFDVMSVPHGNFVANGVIVHNTNFMSNIRRGDNTVDKAETIYNSVKMRLESRFRKAGKLPGLLFLVSSKRTQHDFTERRVREALDDPKVFVRDYAIWDVKPLDQFSHKKFRVLVGDEVERPRIIGDDEELSAYEAGLQIIDVPEDFRQPFERDIESALRDIGGIATIAIRPFIHNREDIMKAVDLERVHPCSTIDWNTLTPLRIIWEELIGTNKIGEMVPLINPDATRVVHIDPSYKFDATGFCMGHTAGHMEVTRFDADGMPTRELAPKIIIDFLLRIVPPQGGEINLADVRNLVYQFSQHGYPINIVTTDSWSAAPQLQLFKQRGYIAEQLSVDLKMDPYNVLKQCLYEQRIEMYQYDVVLDELKRLEYNSQRRKVDHPYPHGTKDVADALCGVVWTLSQRALMGGLGPIRGGHLPSPDEKPKYLPGKRGGTIIWPDEHQPGPEDFTMPFL